MNADVKAEAITFTRHMDGRTTVDGFPETLSVLEQFIQSVDPSVARLDGDRLYITPANGRATYVRMEAPQTPPGISWWARLYASLEPAP